MSEIECVRPLIRTRQIRDFTDEPPSEAALDALAEVARWTGSSRNEQPWRFLVLTDRDLIGRLSEAGVPQTRALRGAPAAIAILLPADPKREVHDAYDDGRVAERLLIGASMLDLGAAITWVRADVRAAFGEMLELPDGWFVRTIMAIGHPSEAGLRPKSAPGQARRPSDEMVFRGRVPER